MRLDCATPGCANYCMVAEDEQPFGWTCPCCEAEQQDDYWQARGYQPALPLPLDEPAPDQSQLSLLEVL